MKKIRLTTLLAALALAAAHAPAGGAIVVWQGEGRATAPAQGSAERKAVLDGVRARLKIKSQFKVYHLKVSGDWAYFFGGEVVAADGELQETDLTVKALLARKGAAGKATWAVAEIWTLPDEERQPFEKFSARVRARQKAENIPADIFPAEL
ncbi:MAG TPA: hypothetical protein VM864_10015 [Pyrinomonadaceae bacterium]|jgi:hypothetical protein|nr:hypothetical protein [Pyrinomonadaceae bacterium]